MPQKIVIICGPTCTGKTKIGIELAKEFGGEIVSCDSQQVYKGLNIGTAKPSKDELAQIPHHLLDVVSCDEQFDVARFVELADAAIKDIARRGKIPFVVGGTGLYIKALCHGLAKSPGRDEAYRAELAKSKGSSLYFSLLNIRRGKSKKSRLDPLYQMLQEKDPEAAKTLKPNDSTRVIRALEVLHVTGRSIREFQSGHGFKDRRYEALKIGLNVERAELYRRIEERVDRMIQDGLMEEVKALVEKYGPEAPGLKAVGYKEICGVIARSPECLSRDDEAIPCEQLCSGDCFARPEKQGELAMTCDQIKQNTRRFAKRQLTWFRADKEIKWFSPDDVPEIKKTVAEFLRIR